MAIQSSELVSITPRVLTGAGADLVFNGLFLTENDMAPVDTVLQFATASAVAEYFGYDSDEYKAAQIYFNGYNNSLQKPSNLLFFRHTGKDTAAFLRGLPSDDETKMFERLSQVTDGKITLAMSSAPIELSDLNFSAERSLSDCARLLQDSINDRGETDGNDAWKKATVTYSSLTKSFCLTSGIRGKQSSISFASGTVADLMGLSKVSQAVLSAGSDALTYDRTLDLVVTHTGNFVSVSTVNELLDVADTSAICAWINSRFNEGNQYLYVYFTTDVTLTAGSKTADNSRVGSAIVGAARPIVAGSGAAIIDDFLDHDYNGVCAVFGDVRYAAFVMGCASSIDWKQPGSTITMAFKTQSGLPASVSDIQTSRNLLEKKINFVGDYASRNEQFVLFYDGRMYGAYKFIDTYLNSTWLNYALQSSLIRGFRSTGRVPYTQAGYTIIHAWVQDVIGLARSNGVIEAGVVLDEVQKNELAREAGRDISTTLRNNGYYMQINEASTQTRTERSSPACNFWYTYGGAVHKLVVPVTTVA